jgi:predicted urease superfamily metal-dependent hydrolase
MTVSSLKTHDAYVWGIVEHLCAKIRAHVPEATVDVGAHPAQRGAMIDAHVSTDDAYAVLDLVNPVLDASLLAEGIAVSVRVLGPS